MVSCVVCVCCHPVYSGRQACGRTSRGHAGGKSQRISPPLLLWCLPLFFSREGFSRYFPSSIMMSNFCVLINVSFSTYQGKLILSCPRSRLRIWSRETASVVPSRILHAQAESGAYLRSSSRCNISVKLYNRLPEEKVPDVPCVFVLVCSFTLLPDQASTIYSIPSNILRDCQSGVLT